MNIEEYVSAAVLAKLDEIDFDADKLRAGIAEYVDDQAFRELEGRFSESVMKSVIANNLSPLLTSPASEICLFFSNYMTIQELKLIDNQALALAKESRLSGKSCSPDALAAIESSLNTCLQHVYGDPDLQRMLKKQVSEILLNIDYAKCPSHVMSQRLKETIK